MGKNFDFYGKENDKISKRVKKSEFINAGTR